MTLFQAIVLGIIQGLSEFLPISSSAHLALTPWLLHWPEPGLSFDVALHTGTLVAVLGYFRDEWIRLARAAWEIVTTRTVATESQRRVVLLVIATIPGGIAGLALDKYAETTFRAPALIAWAMIILGVLLWLADRFNRESAAVFSFLMSMPIIAAAAILKVPHVLHEQGLSAPLVAGVLASAISGWLAIAALLRYVTRRSYGIFALYRVLAGAAVLLIVYYRG